MIPCFCHDVEEDHATDEFAGGAVPVRLLRNPERPIELHDERGQRRQAGAAL